MPAAVFAESLWQLTGIQTRHGRSDWPSDPLTLNIPSGRVAVLGPSGAGKTSLLNLLVGFTRPTRGSIRAPERIAWVPQDHGLWMAHTAIEHLTLVGMPRGQAEALLAEFDLADRATARAGTLSIGEGARLAVARALAMKVPVLVMDEPLAHVDLARSGKYWRTIREHLASSGASLIFATHQPELALAESTHAICLHNGVVEFEGLTSALYESPASAGLATFLGPANWMTAADLDLWLGLAANAERCIRPERLLIEPASEGPIVISARFYGSHAETELRHPAGAQRIFLHRPASPLPIGTRVCLKDAQLA
jgi:iron(III) transport system ATP-binding protein